LWESLKLASTKIAEVGVFGECSKACTFAEIVNSKPQPCVEKENGGVDLRREAGGSEQVFRSAVDSVERVDWSACALDLFLVPIRFESDSDGEGVHSLVDCSALEDFVPVSLEAVAGSELVSSSGLMRLLGQLHLKMDWVLDRVSSKPNCRKKKLRVLGFFGFDMGLNVEPGNGVDPSREQNVDPGRDLVLDPGSVLGSDPGMDMDSGTGLDPVLYLDSNKGN
jgi:hypothetical protein